MCVVQGMPMHSSAPVTGMRRYQHRAHPCGVRLVWICKLASMQHGIPADQQLEMAIAFGRCATAAFCLAAYDSMLLNTVLLSTDTVFPPTMPWRTCSAVSS